jgi:hypothetical protein
MLLLLNRSKRIGDLYAEKDNIGKPVMAIFFFCYLFHLMLEVIGIPCAFLVYDGGNHARYR